MPKITAECAHCSVEYFGRPNRLYCSTACRKAAYRKRERIRHLERRVKVEVALREVAIRQHQRLMSLNHRANIARLENELEQLYT